MLRNTSRLEHAPYRPATRRLVLAALAAVALLVAGLRGPIDTSNDRAQAQQPGAAAQAGAIDLKGVPPDTVVYAVIRPAAILARDAGAGPRTPYAPFLSPAPNGSPHPAGHDAIRNPVDDLRPPRNQPGRQKPLSHRSGRGVGVRAIVAEG